MCVLDFVCKMSVLPQKTVLRMERQLEASRNTLLAMEEEAGPDAVRTLAQFKSPAVPVTAWLNRKRRLRDALAGEAPGEAPGVAVKRNRLEVHDNVRDDVMRARRRLEDGLHDGLGVLLRNKRLSAVQDEELGRRGDEVLRDDVRRRKRFAAARDEEHSRHHSLLVQDDGFRSDRRTAVQEDALLREQVDMVEAKLQGLRGKPLYFDAAEADTMQRHRLEAREKVEASQRYHSVVRELEELQSAKNLRVKVTASSASPPVSKKLMMDEDDVSPMMTAWYGRHEHEPTTPTDLIPSPLFMRGPSGIPGATPDPLCRSPNALCRSPRALCRSPCAR